jgi:AraC-like DNA-binding protein
LRKASTLEKLKSTFAKPIQINEHDFEQVINPYLASYPFIHKDFTLSQMSFDLKISERNLSAYFNNDLHKTFGEWKNDLRIAYVVELIEGGQANKFTIEALATNAGFLSRSKFIDAFKQRQGLTPSAFIKLKKLQTN